MAGIGPAPFAAMMLADHGAEVIRVEHSGMIGFAKDPLRRSRRSISLDLKWVDHFAGKDACVAPVLELGEAPFNPHNVRRGTFIDVDGVTQPGPAPRYSRTRCDAPTGPREEGADGDAILDELGYSAEEIAALRDEAVLP